MKFRICFTFIAVALLLSVAPGLGFCGNFSSKADSLDNVFKNARSPAEKVSILLLISTENMSVNYPKALSSALKAYQIAEQAGDESGKLNVMLKLSWLYYVEADYVKVLNYAVRSKELAEKLGSKSELASSLISLGVAYVDFGEYDKSSEYFFGSLKIYEELNDKRGIAEASSWIGVSYQKQLNYTKALEYFRTSLDLSRKTNAWDGVASNLSSIANVYTDQKDYVTALKNYKEALSIAVKAVDYHNESSISKSIGITYLKMKDYRLSLEYFERAMTLFRKMNNLLRITKCQVQFGEYYFATGDYPKAFSYGDTALEQSRKLGYKEVELNAANLLHRLCIAKKDTLMAYRYASLESILKDSLTSGEKQKTLTKLEAQYQFDKDQAKKAILQQRKDFILIIFFILLVSALIILFLIWGRQKVKARNAILEKENLEKELNFKNKEMVLNVMSLMKKNEMLADLSEKLIKIDSEVSTPEGKDTINKVAKELQKNQEDEIWKEFSLRFKEVHGEFYDKLLANFPTLGPNDLKLCAFLRMNMSSKDIAALTGQRVSSLETARHRLRQKLGISKSDVNLITFLSQI